MRTEHFQSLIDGVERAESSKFVVTVTLEKMGIRVSGRRLSENRFGETVNALRCDRMVGWSEDPLSAHHNPIVTAVEHIERALEGK